MVNHGAFASVADHCIVISVNASSRVLQFASYSFRDIPYRDMVYTVDFLTLSMSLK
jgi:hypothetical protein